MKKVVVVVFLAAVLLSSCSTHSDMDSLNSDFTQPINEESRASDSYTNNDSENVKSSDVSSELQVHFIDVGQGDSTLITCGEHSMLIDAGDNTKGSTVRYYLKKQGIDSLDYVIGTHPDADHIGGLDVIIDNVECGTLFMPPVTNDTATFRDVVDAVEFRNLDWVNPTVGDTYELGEAGFTVIAPNSDYDDPNNYSIGILLTFGNNRFLFTGDAEEEAENDILNNGIDIHADVFKAGHHGSSSSNSQAFLEAVNPKAVVISCGENNSYGHPHDEVLERIHSIGAEIYRTDMWGTIIATSDGNNISWDYISDIKNDESASNESNTVEYVLNVNAEKFHTIECPHVQNISSENFLILESTYDDMVSDGYTPCKTCMSEGGLF